MPATLTVRDESLTGDRRDAITLEFPTERITVRELIRERVYQEVEDYNRGQGDTFKGLVQPEDAMPAAPAGGASGGFRMKQRRVIDWKPQYERAVEAFERNGVLVLVDDVQAESLDQTIELTRGTTVTFLRLVPLVGG